MVAKVPETAVGRNGTYPVEPPQYTTDTHGGLVTVRCIISGVSPLLMNAMSEEQLLNLFTKEKKAKTAARPKPREWADARVYRLKDGNPCLPPRNFYAALVAAGQFVRLDGKRQISTADKTILPGMLTLASAELPLTLPGKSDPAPWEVDIQQGRNPNGGEAVCIIRPRFDEWEFAAELDIDQSVMPLAMARELVELAGRRMGLGDFRPQKRGTFGRFVIRHWEH